MTPYQEFRLWDFNKIVFVVINTYEAKWQSVSNFQSKPNCDINIYKSLFYSVERSRQPWNWDVYISSAKNIVLNSDLFFAKKRHTSCVIKKIKKICFVSLLLDISATQCVWRWKPGVNMPSQVMPCVSRIYSKLHLNSAKFMQNFASQYLIPQQCTSPNINWVLLFKTGKIFPRLVLGRIVQTFVTFHVSP